MRIQLNSENSKIAHKEIYGKTSDWHEDLNGNIYSDINALILTQEEHNRIVNAQKDVVELLHQIQKIVRNDNGLNEWFNLKPEIHELANIQIINNLTTYGRFDWVFCNGHLQVLEFNSETPMGWCESIDYTNKAHKYFNSYNNANSELELLLGKSIRKTLESYCEIGKGNIAIVGDLDDAEENETFELLRKITSKVNPNVYICSISELKVITDGNHLEDGLYIDRNNELIPIHILQTFYSVEWMFNDDGSEQLIELLEKGKVGLMNPVSTLQLHSKSIFALIWFLYNETNLLDGYSDIIESHIPFTSFQLDDFTEDYYAEYDRLVVKPLNHREGSGVEILKKKDIIQSDDWVIYQEYLDVDKVTHIRNNTIKGSELIDFNHTIGVYCIDDKFGGYYTRLSEGVCSIYDAIFIPTFVEKGE